MTSLPFALPVLTCVDSSPSVVVNRPRPHSLARVVARESPSDSCRWGDTSQHTERGSPDSIGQRQSERERYTTR
jgi:hypothetical protein